MFHSTIGGARRRLAVGGATLVAALALAGCSSSGSSGSQTLTTDPKDVKGSITFQTWWAYANQSLVDGFSKKYPNVKVKLQFTAIDSYPTKIQSQASSGALPDVFAAQGAYLVSLAKAHQLYDLGKALGTKAYDGSASSWKASFQAPLLKGANAGLAEPNGETFGVPFNAISVAAAYNEDAYAKAGVTPPTSFSQLLSNCTKLKAAGYIPMSLTGTVWAGWWPALAWDQTMSGEKAADFSVSDPNYVKGFSIVKKMVDAGCWSDSQVSSDIAGETSLFLQQKTATFVTVPENFIQAVSEGAKFKLGTYVLPALDGKTPNHTLGGGNANVLVVNAKSKNLSAAVAFAKYLTSTEVESKLSKQSFTIPSIDIQSGNGNPLMTAYTDAAKNGFTDSTAYMPSLTTAGQTTFATEVLPSLLLGKLTPEQAAAATDGLYATQ